MTCTIGNFTMSFHNAQKKPNLSSGPKLRKINKHERLECFQFRQKKFLTEIELRDLLSSMRVTTALNAQKTS